MGSEFMKKKIALILSSVFLIISVCGCNEQKAAEPVEAKLVKTQQVTEDTYDIKLDYQGVIKSKETKNYSFLSGGRVKSVFVTEGQMVHKGDKLAQLDAVELISGASQSSNNELISQNNLDKTEATYLTNITNAEVKITTLNSNLKALDSNIEAYIQSISAAEKGIEDFQKSIPIAEQGIDALEKTVDTDNSQIESVKKNMEAYDVKLSSTRQAVELAKTNLEKMKVLYEEGAVAKSELEDMQVKYDDAEASYKQAEAQKSSNEATLKQLEAAHETNVANLESKRNEVSSLNTQLESNKAQVNSMYAQLDSLKSQRVQAAAQIVTANTELENLKRSMYTDIDSQKAAAKISQLSAEQAQRAVNNAVLTADTDGYVMAVNIKSGEMTGAGTPVVIVKSQTKIVSIGVSIDDYSMLDSVMDIKINGETQGKIDSISQYPDEATRTYTVDIAFDNDELSMGEIVDVELITAKGTGVFIPIDSIINIDGIDYVYKVNDDNTVTRVQVELSEVKDAMVRAKNLVNEKIVVSGMKSLNDNDKITEEENAETENINIQGDGEKE